MAGAGVRAGRRPGAPARGNRPQGTARSTGRTSTAPAPAGGEPAGREPAARRRPARHLTGRAAVLLVTVAALAVTLAWPARALYEQRREVAALRADTAASQARIAALQSQLDRWRDPAYVEAQARARLHFVRPGETAYVVIGSQADSAQVTPRPVERATAPWFAALWGSVQGAASDAG